MKRLHKLAAICIILLFFSFTTNLMAQTHEENSTVSDTTTTDKGDLNLLSERLYLAFKAYRTGKYEFDKIESEVQTDSARVARAARADSLLKAGWLVNYSVFRERPIHPVIFKGKNLVDNDNYRLNLNSVPADSIMSIEVMDVGTGISSVYGTSSRGIVIRLKE